MKNSLVLYQLLGAGRQVIGSFGSKIAAIKAMRNYNSKIVKGIDSPAFVSPGPDHWRSKHDRSVPVRPAECVWQVINGEPTLVRVPW